MPRLILAIGLYSALLCGAVSSSKTKQPVGVKDSYPFYLSTQEIHDAIQDLSSRCSGELSVTQRSEMNSGSSAGTQVTLDVVRLKRATSVVARKKKAVFVFNEHARELVSGESALHFLKTLCGEISGGEVSLTQVSSSGHKALPGIVDLVRNGMELVIVPNSNPLSRRTVEEQGAYCKRTNEDNVDLNRNWGDDHRDPNTPEGDEMYPGTNGFSEPETRILRDLVREEQPDLFLSIHSGAYLLGAPFGYTRKSAPPNQDRMLSMLGRISQQFCGGMCPYGGLAEMIGYDSNGCDIDYVSETLKVPYAYTWEIYTSPEIRERYEDEAKARATGQPLGAESQGFFGSQNGLSGGQDSGSPSVPNPIPNSAAEPAGLGDDSSFPPSVAAGTAEEAPAASISGEGTGASESSLLRTLMGERANIEAPATTTPGGSSASAPSDSFSFGFPQPAADGTGKGGVFLGIQRGQQRLRIAAGRTKAQQHRLASSSQTRRNRLRRNSVATKLGMLEPEASEDPQDCFAQFNPPDAASLKSVVENWTGAYLELCSELLE